MGEKGAGANVKVTTAAAEAAAPKPVVTNPEAAQQIPNAFVSVLISTLSALFSHVLPLYLMLYAIVYRFRD